MIKKVYNISGFDCANCAQKVESYLNTVKGISYARIDFSLNRLYITFVSKELGLEEVKKLISEVESDPIELSYRDGGTFTKSKILNKAIYVLFLRIFIATLLTVTCFILNKSDFYWVRFYMFLGALVILLYDIVYKVIYHIFHRENIVDHNLLITISSIGAFVLPSLELDMAKFPDGHFEAIMVVLLFQVGRIIESIATNKSKSAVMQAISLRVESANKITDDEISKVSPEDLDISDRILIKTGEVIPVDCEVIEGEGYIDSSSLTGEYIPLLAKVGSFLNSGCIVKNGSLKAKVINKYCDSTISKIEQLITQGGEKKSKADEFIAKFSKLYTPIICGLAILAFIIGGLITKDWDKFVLIGLEILVTGCPCAIVISLPLAYFSAIGLASKNGMVIKGSNYLDLLNNMTTLITDKTGTLTHGSFSIQKIHTEIASENEFLDYLYAVECLSSHPIGKAICHGKDFKQLASQQVNFIEHSSLGVETTYRGKHIYAGGYKLFNKLNIDIPNINEVGTTVYVAVDNKYVGYVVLNDTMKEDAQPMVDLLHKENIEILLLTGDKKENAQQICSQLGIDRFYSDLLPEDKVKILEYEKEEKNKVVAFIGDGINDAPSIIRSDIGIAMGGIGSDIAVENADVVIMNDDPAKVYDAIKVSKMARNTSLFNIIFALLIKFAVMVLILITELPIMMLVAVIADTGLTVLLVLNSLLLLYRKIKRPNLKK